MIMHKFIRKSNYNSEQKYQEVTYLVFSDVRSGVPPFKGSFAVATAALPPKSNETKVVDGCIVVPCENEEEDGADDSLRLWVGCR